ncbi:hypothetical protein [Halovenus sp. HT40]
MADNVKSGDEFTTLEEIIAVGDEVSAKVAVSACTVRTGKEAEK